MKEKHGYFLEDLTVGMTAVFAKTVTEADIKAAAAKVFNRDQAVTGWVVANPEDAQ